MCHSLVCISSQARLAPLMGVQCLAIGNERLLRNHLFRCVLAKSSESKHGKSIYCESEFLSRGCFSIMTLLEPLCSADPHMQLACVRRAAQEDPVRRECSTFLRR